MMDNRFDQNNNQEDTNEKEGGSQDPYTNEHISEISPEISKTDAEPSSFIDGDDVNSSSFKDSPISTEHLDLVKNSNLI
jgi:hypothetical protein